MTTRRLSHWFAAVAVGCCVALTATPAGAQAMRKRPTLQDLTDDADTIYIARCVKSEAFFRDGNIYSRYQLKPSEYWKGRPQLSSNGEVTLEQVGGSLESPMPITQYSDTSVVLGEGQEILIFTRERQAKPDDSGETTPATATPAVRTPSVAYGNFGVYGVVRNPETGQRLLVPGGASSRMKGEAVSRVAAHHAAQRSAAQNGKAAAQKTPAAAQDRISPFEPLQAVKSRVLARVSAASSAKEAEKP
jgi:hypothetical protein